MMTGMLLDRLEQAGVGGPGGDNRTRAPSQAPSLSMPPPPPSASKWALLRSVAKVATGSSRDSVGIGVDHSSSAAGGGSGGSGGAHCGSHLLALESTGNLVFERGGCAALSCQLQLRTAGKHYYHQEAAEST
mmetsp:Transcript_62080/g.124457  ORF Transcript_62080/g.124457 Transcript_62080/m.124457 type:complete len:132 (-) Transcript_62080:1049-1444(-)